MQLGGMDGGVGISADKRESSCVLASQRQEAGKAAGPKDIQEVVLKQIHSFPEAVEAESSDHSASNAFRRGGAAT